MVEPKLVGVGEDTGTQCVECFKGHLIKDENNEGHCDKCGTVFVFLDETCRVFQYK